jgi:serine/threonine-protein kinase
MLLGRPPFQAAQSIDVIFKHLNEAPPTFGSIWPGNSIPAEVEALVMKCLTKRPADRFQSMDEVLDAIRRASNAAGISGAFSSPRPAMPGSGPITGPLSGPTTTGASTVALDISVVEPTAKKGKKLVPIALFGGCVLLGAGVALVLAVRAPEKPLAVPSEPPAAVPTSVSAQAAQPKPPAPAEAQPAAANPSAAGADGTADLELAPLTAPAGASVLFRIDSEPSGARVSYGGKDLGPTPVELPVPVGAGGRASAELTFTLDGYQRTVATAAGEGPEQAFTQKLKKKTSARPKGGSSGYKDDPYQ